MKNRDPISIVNAFNAARNIRDPETALSFFAPDAVVRIEPSPLSGTGVYKGEEEIRNWLEEQSEENFHVESNNFEVAGNKVTFYSKIMADRFRQLDIELVDGTGEVTLQGGKIKSFTFRFSPTTVRRLQAAAVAV